MGERRVFGWQATEQYLLEFNEKRSLVFTLLEKLRENIICRMKHGRLKLLLCVGHFSPICCWWLMLSMPRVMQDQNPCTISSCVCYVIFAGVSIRLCHVMHLTGRHVYLQYIHKMITTIPDMQVTERKSIHVYQKVH